ncbi:MULTISPECIES: sensor histidine kinase [Paenibacillus]|uniref:histidine kinase n=1 Tax=Paenibacillus lactis 154 TaxID=743719 RepID=G4HJH2_9BACL|nr:histidine kinase [Paenibacillus lactis]EHB62426.1 integral membrane sensor signal transduction histidine kinase [Paenibacillus lactis 154]
MIVTYKQNKWLILTIPTLTIGVWEYVRHEFLLPYISMELGNWLAPVIVLLVSLLFLTKLFAMIEHNQEELNRAKAIRAVLEEREKIARELHDGIAQSLFFLNAQISQMDRMNQADGLPLHKLKESVHRTNDYVRQAIANLRHEADADKNPWLQGIESLIDELQQETALEIETNWRIPETMLSSKERVELFAIIREALLNIHKHAEAKQVRIEARPTESGWMCQVADDGKGFNPDNMMIRNRYGIQMMRDRAKAMSWHFSLERKDGDTLVIVRKGAY